MALKSKLIVCLLLVIMVVLLTDCNNNGQNGLKTTIHGSFPNLAGKTVTLSEFDVNSAIPVDTAKIDKDGGFRFRFRRMAAGFFLVKIDNKNFITLVLDKEKDIEVFSDQPNIRKNYTVKGSPDSELFRDFEMFTEINRAKVDSLSRTFDNNQRLPSFRQVKPELDKKYQSIFDQQRQYAMRFIENHCASLASVLVLNKRFGERKILAEDNDYPWFIMADSCLAPLYPDNKHIIELNKRVALIKQTRKIIDKTEEMLSIGKTIPDISLKDRAGNEVSLYSLEGRPVILYFWASWDPASRKGNKLISEIAAGAREKPAVYAIALETYKELWDDAIKADGLQKWINVTDLLNIHSSAKTMFNIPDELPYFFYLDKDLIIRYKGSNYDDLARVAGR